MTEKEYKEYIEECDKWIDDFNRIAKKLGVEPTGGDVPINMAFILKLLRAIEKVLDSQSSTDALSRQAVIDYVDEATMGGWFEVETENYIKKLKEMPPVTPKPKTGHWTHDGSHWANRWLCSKCGYKLFDEQSNYCPNCGADMREGD